MIGRFYHQNQHADFIYTENIGNPFIILFENGTEVHVHATLK